MAEGFARHYGGDAVEVRSAGTQPGSRVSETAVAVMRERGIDISGHVPKGIDLAYADAADHIVTMGCRAEEACPARLFPKIRDWPIPDPIGKGEAVYRGVRDDIERRVRALLEEIGMPASAS